MNVYRWGRYGRSKRPNHGRDKADSGGHGSVCRTAVLSWTLRRFRQMDTILSSLKLQEALLKEHLKRVFLSEPVQSHCTAGDPSRQHSCLGVSIMSEPLLGGEVVNRVDQPPALQEFPPFGGRCAELGAARFAAHLPARLCRGLRAENAVKPVDLSDK